MSHGTREGMRAPAYKEGRNRRKCERYALTGRRDKNKARRAAKRAHTFMKRAQNRAIRELTKGAEDLHQQVKALPNESSE